MMEKHRNPTVDLLRGIAALCMILGHSFIVYPVDISGVPWCAALKYVIYSFHMELFFLLSGWVWKGGAYFPLLRKKALRLLVPYFFFGSVSLILHVVGGSLVNGSTSITEGLVKLLFRGGSYWFLFALFIISALYPLITGLFISPRAKMILIAFILLLNNFVDWPNLFTLSAVMNYFPFFIAGDLIGKSKYGKAQALPGNRAVLIGATAAAFAIPHLLQAVGVLRLAHILTFFSTMAFCSLLYALCTWVQLPGKAGSFIRSLLNDASRYSLQLYLFNGYCLTAIRIILCSVLHITSPVLIVSGIWLGSVAITLFVCKVILPKSRFLSFLCGQPFPKRSPV